MWRLPSIRSSSFKSKAEEIRSKSHSIEQLLGDSCQGKYSEMSAIWRPEGHTADQIVANDFVPHSTWHFHQAASWLDLGKRTQKPSSLHYAAFEMRYGIEYLLFELIVLRSRGLTDAQYEKCIGDPREMKKLLGSPTLMYEKLARFSQILMSLDPNSPQLRVWNISELFRAWGIASEFLHFVGAHVRTYNNIEWLIKGIARIEEVLAPICAHAQSGAVGVLVPGEMEPEVSQAWDDYREGRLTEQDLAIRMQIAKPVLAFRRRR